jgi:hypothetical protein
MRRLYAAKSRVPRVAVERLGVHPARFGYRWWQTETMAEYARRMNERGASATFRAVHPPKIFTNALPRNVRERNALPDDRGWWGYSFRDVPERRGGETFFATVPDCRIVHYFGHPDHPLAAGEFFPAILSHDGRALNLREIRFREAHADLLRRGRPPVRRLEKATWILERVYDNYSHWFTAHMPKLLWLKKEGLLGDVLLPPDPSSVIRDSLRLLGIDVADFGTYEPGTVLDVEQLTILGTDRFRPELLQSVRDAFWTPAPAPPARKIFVSREKAERRRLLNEAEVWPLLEQAGFERVVMEDLSFAEQVGLMRETAILFAMHGAGLTNMMFCGPETHVVEIADLGFPNPNFYAVASALGHHYWLLSGTAVGEEHPLQRDMKVDPDTIRNVLPELLAAAA